MPNYWEQSLLTASLNYVEFPVAERSVSTGRNFARYVYPYRDGQGVEDLGRKVYQFSLTVPLFRGVSPEHYPDTYDRLIAIIEDDDLRGEVEYVDPEHGPINVKIIDYGWRTVAERRDGGVLTIQLEERGFAQSLLQNLSSPELAGRARASQLAQDVDFGMAALGLPPEEQIDGGSFSLTAAWQQFQATIDAGALAADEVAAVLDEITLITEKVLSFSALDELQRFSIYNAAIDFLGATQDVADEAATPIRALIQIVLADDMDAFGIAARYLGDASRADEVIFQNPGDPLLYPRGSTVLVPQS
jgi:prophage DNA circulation protein